MKEYTLSSGYKMPEIGFGTWKLKEKLPEILDEAYKSGYRHIDTASHYENEDIIGKWLAKKQIRESMFITTKLWNDCHDCVEKACAESMKRLNLTYIDLYLVHFPVNSKGEFNVVKLWKDMEKLVESGKVRSIGCSNFGIINLKKILSFCKIKPAALQIELHPYLQQEELRKFCKEQKIQVISYCSLGSNVENHSIKNDLLIKKIAEKHNTTVCTILLSFCTNLECCVIPKSSNFNHIKTNMITVKLDKDDMEEIKTLEKGFRYNDVQSFGPNRFD